MKTLIVEDDFTGRLLLQELLKHYGPTHIAVNGQEAVEAVRLALEADEPYNLICLDIMMPELDGHAALKQIRALEEEAGTFVTYRTKIVMTTTLLSDTQNAAAAYRSLCDAYLAKPIDKPKLLETLRRLQLIST